VKTIPDAWLAGTHFYAVVLDWKGFKHTPQPLDAAAERKAKHMGMMATALRKSKIAAAETEGEHKKARVDIGKLSNRKAKK
jgi:hypothetical protein